MNAKLIIGITDCSKYPNYERWFLREPHVEVIRLAHSLDNIDEVKKCGGIVLTGGEDVHPRFYQHPEFLPLCDKDNMDEQRDEFEWKVMDRAKQYQLPLLGICRGLQMANVFYGGTLIPDIPSAGKPDHSKSSGIDRTHPVSIQKGTILSQITNAPGGEVNSAHHQSAGTISKDLRVNAISADGIVEGLEWNDPQDKPYLMLVQWHPERMTNQESPLVKNIRESFLKSVNPARTGHHEDH